MTDNEKIQEEFEEWLGIVGMVTDDWAYACPWSAFTAGYICGQREAYMQMIADDAQRYGDYEV